MIKDAEADQKVVRLEAVKMLPTTPQRFVDSFICDVSRIGGVDRWL